MPRTIIVGAGLVGSVLASCLVERGHSVDVFDRMPDPRLAGRNIGRSINLTLCRRGFDVLDAIGVGDQVRAQSVPVYGRLIHDNGGECKYQPYGNDQEAIHSIARADLGQILVNFAEQNNVRFRFDHKCVGAELERPSLQFKDTRSGELEFQAADWIFGADGAHSAVRAQMQRKMRINLGLQYWDQGYKEITVPARSEGWTAQKNAIHVWPRGGYMLIGFPNVDHSFTCSLHLPFEGPLSFESLTTAAELRALFESSFSDVIDYMPALEEEFFKGQINSMITIKCSPWSFQGKVAILGDAAHSIYPSYGQGANAGFEDCAVLVECISKYPGNGTAALREFESRRRPNTDAIAELCIHHFAELRDLVGNPHFLLRKRLERQLSSAYPLDYKDLYSMISFTTLPYTEALRIDLQQRTIVDELMRLEGLDKILETSELETLASRLMADFRRLRESPVPADQARRSLISYSTASASDGSADSGTDSLEPSARPAFQ